MSLKAEKDWNKAMAVWVKAVGAEVEAKIAETKAFKKMNVTKIQKKRGRKCQKDVANAGSS